MAHPSASGNGPVCYTRDDAAHRIGRRRRARHLCRRCRCRRRCRLRREDPAPAEPVTHLRFAGIAPEGTSWAREARAFAREVEAQSQGRVVAKMYLGAIAGDDLEMGRRLQRDQLDGALSAGILCQEVAPSLRVFRVPGLILDRGEDNHILTRLWPTLQEEARRHGVVLLAAAALGRDVVAARLPVDSLATLRRLRLWQWHLDTTAVAYSRAMGLTIVPMPVEDAARAFEAGQLDGFVAIPSAILGYQWFTKRLELAELPFALLPGCVVMSAAAFDRLSSEAQRIIGSAAAKLGGRFAEVTQQQDAQLLGGVFARYGVRTNPTSARFRLEFLDAARRAREKLGAGVVAADLLLRVQSYLADYRAVVP